MDQDSSQDMLEELRQEALSTLVRLKIVVIFYPLILPSGERQEKWSREWTKEAKSEEGEARHRGEH